VMGRYLTDRTWSPLLQRLLISALSGGGSYVDVGANIGLTTVPVARNAKVRCYAFEPEPLNFAYLRANLALNRVGERVTPFQLAAFSRKETLTLELSKHNFGDHRIRGYQSLTDRTQPLRQVMQVDAAPLDSVLEIAALTAPIVCKVDTQGAEVEVLKGGANLLQHCALLITEVEPSCLIRLGRSVDDLLQVVQELNFAGGFLTSFDGTDLRSHPPPSYMPISSLIEDVRRTIERASLNDYWDLVLVRSPEIYQGLFQ